MQSRTDLPTGDAAEVAAGETSGARVYANLVLGLLQATPLVAPAPPHPSSTHPAFFLATETRMLEAAHRDLHHFG